MLAALSMSTSDLSPAVSHKKKRSFALLIHAPVSLVALVPGGSVEEFSQTHP